MCEDNFKLDMVNPVDKYHIRNRSSLHLETISISTERVHDQKEVENNWRKSIAHCEIAKIKIDKSLWQNILFHIRQ